MAAAAAAGSKEKEEEEEALELRQGSKLFSRLLTRESSAAAPSFRVYYGVASAGAVPFLWESQPGTPKNAISAAALPPLTPPPSYYVAGAKDAPSPSPSSFSRRRKAAAAAGGSKKSRPAGGGVRILGSLLPKIILRRASWSSMGSPTSSCSSSSSSSSSSFSLSFRSVQSTPACSSTRSQVHAFSAGDDDDDDEGDDRMVATACFNVRHESFRAFKGCRVAVTARSALASIAGGGHGAPNAASAQKA